MSLIDSFFPISDTDGKWGCRQIQILHRHGARYPTGTEEDAENDDRFAAKIASIVQSEGPQAFSGPLSVSRAYYIFTELGLRSRGKREDAAVAMWNSIVGLGERYIVA